MADIDIEEHDLFDNPLIKKIFPDIKALKAEIEEHVEEANANDEQDVCHQPVGMVFDEDIKNEEQEVPCRSFRIVFDEDCKSEVEDVNDQPSSMVIDEDDKNEEQDMKHQPSRMVFDEDCKSEEQEVPHRSFRIVFDEDCKSEEEDVDDQPSSMVLDEDDINEEQDMDHQSFRLVYEEDSKDFTYPDKIDLDSPPSTPNTLEPVVRCEIISSSNPVCSDSPKLIKPVVNEHNLPEARVVLKDWGEFLRTNPCFCSSCEILFPTQNLLDSHKMSSHSFLVAIENSKQPKSKPEGFASRIKFQKNTNLLCKHCNVTFPSEIALLKHTYESVPGTLRCNQCDLAFESEAACRSHQANHSKSDYLLCQICSCHFKFERKLATHMRVKHCTDEVEPTTRIPSNFDCFTCGQRLDNAKYYNLHIQTHHRQLYNKPAKGCKPVKIKCPQCTMRFSSSYFLNLHMTKKHKVAGGVEKNPPENINPPAIRQSDKRTTVMQERHPVPESTIYKCYKCQIHFTSCRTAVLHSRFCTSKKGDFECPHCQCFFKRSDQFYHLYQHSITKKLKVIEISQNILSKILCRCRKCMVCFDERSLMTYHAESCIAEDTMVCKECHISIHPRAMALHIKNHKEGVKRKDFIVVDYIHMSPDADQAVQAKHRKVSQKPACREYFYCPTCQCYMQRNRPVNKHSIGKCNTKLHQVICKVCGLRFTHKGFKSHLMQHKLNANLRLRDLRFTNIQTNTLMIPPLPIFKKCTDCGIDYSGSIAMDNHICNSEELKVCPFCGIILSGLMRKLHVSFHLYAAKSGLFKNEELPKITKTYDSLRQDWNIVFLCQTCDVVLDTYDKTVDHCLDHYCNMEKNNTTIGRCTICDLNFLGDSYEAHRELHTNANITKKMFKILKYNYDWLPSEDWLNMLASLTRRQADLILSKSIYKLTRCVRMKMISDGPLALTLFQCGTCRVVVPENKIVDHAKRRACSENAKKFNCEICTLGFSSAEEKTAHRNVHELHKLKDESYKSVRLIQFLDVGQVSQNDELSHRELTEEQNELKFVTCQHCGKVVDKSKYRKHVLHHKYYSRKMNPKLILKPTSMNTEKIIHIFYRCRDCNLCVSKKKIKEHVCDANLITKECPKCPLYFRPHTIVPHLKYHERYKLTKNNMKITVFDNSVSEPKQSQIRKTNRKDINVSFYQCSNCGVCIQKKFNTKKHSCTTSAHIVTCKLCDLSFHGSHFRAHKHLHDVLLFTSEHVTVHKFTNDKSPPSPDTPASEHRKRTASLSPADTTLPKTPKAAGSEIDFELSDKQYNRYVSVRYFKCKKCDLHFVTSSSLLWHEGSSCGERGVKCSDCGLMFHSTSIDIHNKHQKCKQTHSKQRCIVTVQSTGKSPEDERNWLYLCRRCDLYNISFAAICYHFRNNHKCIRKPVKCNKCDILFTFKSVTTHANRHHDAKKFTLSDLSIATVEESRESDANDVTVIRTPVRDCRVEIRNDQVAAKLAAGIYGCDVCGINFINVKSLSAHKSFGRHDDVQHSCSKCGLSFDHGTLKRHLLIHHPKHDTEKPIRAVSSRRASTKDVGDSPATSASRLSDESSKNLKAVAKRTRGPNQLFQCVVCDVYFLTAAACKDHTTKHTAFDPTEYIACKMCNLQFPCEYLGNHMKSHRNNTFCIDNLIVTEYQPGGNGKLRIDTVDRSKYKVGSTQVENRDVNCVDSATAP